MLFRSGKSGRVVQGARFRYESLRRRGFEPHLLHFKGGKGRGKKGRKGKKGKGRRRDIIEDNVAEWSKACDSKSLLLWRRRFKSCHCRFLVGKYMSGAKQGGGHIGSLRQGKESKESTTKRAG